MENLPITPFASLVLSSKKDSYKTQKFFMENPILFAWNYFSLILDNLLCGEALAQGNRSINPKHNIVVRSQSNNRAQM